MHPTHHNLVSIISSAIYPPVRSPINMDAPPPYSTTPDDDPDDGAKRREKAHLEQHCKNDSFSFFRKADPLTDLLTFRPWQAACRVKTETIDYVYVKDIFTPPSIACTIAQSVAAAMGRSSFSDELKQQIYLTAFHWIHEKGVERTVRGHATSFSPFPLRQSHWALERVADPSLQTTREAVLVAADTIWKGYNYMVDIVAELIKMFSQVSETDQDNIAALAVEIKSLSLPLQRAHREAPSQDMMYCRA